MRLLVIRHRRLLTGLMSAAALLTVCVPLSAAGMLKKEKDNA